MCKHRSFGDRHRNIEFWKSRAAVLQIQYLEGGKARQLKYLEGLCYFRHSVKILKEITADHQKMSKTVT